MRIRYAAGSRTIDGRQFGSTRRSTSSGSSATSVVSVVAIGSSTKPSVPACTARVPAGSPPASGTSAGADVPSV